MNRQGRRAAVTIHDVSERAGVSLSTVSRVLNDHTTVNSSMRDRVLQAVRELGYRPNMAARTLKTNRSRLIVFLTREISNPYFTETYRGINSVAEQRGYVTLIYEACDVSAGVRAILTRGADGVIMDAFYEKGSKESLQRAGIAFVQTNAPAALNSEESSVRVDVYAATLEVLTYLQSQGHRQIGLICGSAGADIIDERERAFRDFASREHIADPRRLIFSAVPLQDKFVGGYAGMRELLSRNAGVSAVVALNDFVAIGAMAGARSLGKRIPDDLSIVGFDNTTAAQYANPPLTTVDIPTFKQGEIAARMLLDIIERPDEPRYSVQLQTSLVVRESVRHL